VVLTKALLNANLRLSERTRSIANAERSAVRSREARSGVSSNFASRGKSVGDEKSALQNACIPHEHWLSGVNADGADSQDAIQ
jgi:hypothetical protein